MSESVKTKTVPFSNKLAFGFGMLANQMFPAVLSIFMVVLVQDLGFPGWMWGVIFFFPRIFDAFTDPIMGFISDNTRSKWGRRRQYVFVGAIVMGVSFMIMWQLYADNSVNYNFTYFMAWSVVFFLGLTIFSVPYVAMGYEMSEDFHERTQIMAIAQWIGQWAWVIAPWFWVIMYDPEWFASAEVATRTLAVWVGGIFMVCAMIPAIFIKGESTLDRDDYTPIKLKTIGIGFKQIINSFVEAFKSKPFRKLCISTFLIFNAFNTVAAFTFFVIVYHLFGGDAGAAGVWPTLFGSLGALATTFIVIPIVTRMSRIMGKKKAFIVSQSISIIGYILFWFLLIPGKPYMFIIALPFFSFGIGSLFTLMMSMTADVIDLDELINGGRREGIFGAIYWWMVKFGFAIAGGLSGVILSVVGFSADALPGPIPIGEVWPGITGLRAFFSGLPILGTFIAILVMWTYDIDEERANEIREALAKRKGEISSDESKSEKEPVKELNEQQVEETPFSSETTITYELFKSRNMSFREERFLNFKQSDMIEKLDYMEDLSEDEIKKLFKRVLDSGIHGFCFSLYEENQKPGDAIYDGQIHRRIQILKNHTDWIRSFSCTEGNELIPPIAKEYGLKTLVGAWLGSDLDKNEEEIESLIRLGKEGYVDIAAVGNEVLYRNDLTEEQLLDYMRRVKEALPDIPVSYVDAYYEFVQKPAITELCDVILCNCYPFWEGTHFNDSLQHMRQMYYSVKEVAGDKRVIISETGWPSEGESLGGAFPSKESAMKYFINTILWTHDQEIEVFYFSSFDESWKVQSEGTVGAYWGIWDSKEKLKY